MNKYQKILDSLKTNKKYITNEVKELKIKKKKIKIKLLNQQRALELVKEVAIKTQQQLEFHLSDMVTSGLNTVFDEIYSFVVQFTLRRDNTECDFFFKKNGHLIEPEFSGIGASDIAAFSLRCASWTMIKKYRNVLILDEPFKHLKGEQENKRVIELMKILSEKLNLQIICINDERASREDIINGANKVFEVKQTKGVSYIKELK